MQVRGIYVKYKKIKKHLKIKNKSRIFLCARLNSIFYLTKMCFHSSVNTSKIIVKIHHIVQLRKQHKKPFQGEKSTYMFSSLTMYNKQTENLCECKSKC